MYKKHLGMSFRGQKHFTLDAPPPSNRRKDLSKDYNQQE